MTTRNAGAAQAHRGKNRRLTEAERSAALERAIELYREALDELVEMDGKGTLLGLDRTAIAAVENSIVDCESTLAGLRAPSAAPAAADDVDEH